MSEPPIAARERIEDFLRRVEAAPPRAISVGAAADSARAWVGDRVVVGIGVGFPNDSGISGFVLHKRSEDATKPARALSRRAAELGPTELGQHGTVRVRDRTPADALAFVVKDASPDAVLAALLVTANVFGVELGAELEPWLESISSWDRGQMPNEPFQSWPALASALSHLRLSIEPEMVSREPDSEAFKLVLGFLIQSLLAKLDPERMPPKLTGAGRRAIVALERQRQLYEEIHAHSAVLELSVPLRDASDRRVTVDALCCVEFEPSDAVKLFARGDRKRSPSGRGFDVAACYRPRVAGWNRYTIFAQPELSLDLTELWVELERRETGAYRSASGIDRRADARTPARSEWLERPGTARSFDPTDLDLLTNKAGAARQLSGVENYWANPWFLIDDASLVASPGIDENRRPAESSRLRWGDVTDSLLEAFHPLGKISVQAVTRAGPRAAQTTELLRAPLLDFSDGPPFFRYVQWDDPGSPDQNRFRAIQLGRFTIQYLAALAESPANAEIRPDRLPPSGACKLLELNGGFAVLAQRGCLVANDWHTESLNEAAILDVLARISKWCERLDTQLESLKAMDQRFQAWLGGSRADAEVFALIGDVVQQRAQFAVDRAASSPMGVTDPNARLLYDEVLRFWGVPSREALVDQGHARLEQNVRALHEARSSRLLKFVGLVSFPVFVAPTFAKPTVDLANTWLLSRGRPIATGETAKSLLGGAEFLAWAAWASLLFFLLRRAFSRSAARSR